MFKTLYTVNATNPNGTPALVFSFDKSQLPQAFNILIESNYKIGLINKYDVLVSMLQRTVLDKFLAKVDKPLVGRPYSKLIQVGEAYIAYGSLNISEKKTFRVLNALRVLEFMSTSNITSIDESYSKLRGQSSYSGRMGLQPTHYSTLEIKVNHVLSTMGITKAGRHYSIDAFRGLSNFSEAIYIGRHPLLDPNSKHYDTGVHPTIYDIEKELNVIEMLGACRFNIMKYESREKGSNEADERKVGYYKAYVKLLEMLNKLFINDLNVRGLIDEFCRISYD